MRRTVLSFFIVLFLVISSGCSSDVEYLLVSPNGAWQKQGTVMVGRPEEEYSVQEPSVLYENGAFKMWFTCGWFIEGMCYATSPDGLNWTRPNSVGPLINNVAHGFVLKIAETYYYYGAILPASTGFGRWHSSDGVTWVQDASNILPATSGWDAGQRGNIFVWIEGDTWHALFDALGADTIWRSGVASSPDGLNWTEASGNPKIELGSGSCGGPEVYKVSSVYYVWVQCSTSSYLPTDLYRFQSSDLDKFTRSQAWPVMARTTPDEGPSVWGGQVADPSMVEVSGKTYMFYDATDTQFPADDDGIHLKLAIAAMPIAQLVTTEEGTRGPDVITSSADRR